MTKMSLIIPVYNVENYLRECLNSCINQTLKDIEIICINDCSPDASDVILNEYTAKDKRIKVINHETNKGLGAARNTGIANATGEYIWFIDSDDFITLDACSVLYDIAKDENIDVLRFNGIVFKDVNKRRKFIKSNYYTNWNKNQVINVNQNEDFLVSDYTVSSCMYISKLSFIKDFKFREGVYYEDTDFTPILFASCERLMCIIFSAYYRRITENSITQSSPTRKHLHDRLMVLKSLENYVTKNNISENNYIYRFYKSMIKGYGLKFVDEYINAADSEIMELYNYYSDIINRKETFRMKSFFRYFKYFIPYGIYKILKSKF